MAERGGTLLPGNLTQDQESLSPSGGGGASLVGREAAHVSQVRWAAVLGSTLRMPRAVEQRVQHFVTHDHFRAPHSCPRSRCARRRPSGCGCRPSSPSSVGKVETPGTTYHLIRPRSPLIWGSLRCSPTRPDRWQEAQKPPHHRARNSKVPWWHPSSGMSSAGRRLGRSADAGVTIPVPVRTGFLLAWNALRPPRPNNFHLRHRAISCAGGA